MQQHNVAPLGLGETLFGGCPGTCVPGYTIVVASRLKTKNPEPGPGVLCLVARKRFRLELDRRGFAIFAMRETAVNV
jgi:hypothetical protein